MVPADILLRRTTVSEYYAKVENCAKVVEAIAESLKVGWEGL